MENLEAEKGAGGTLVMQNPSALRTKLIKLAKLQAQAAAKTILYLGDKPDRLDQVYEILDRTRETHDNAVFMRTVMREAEELDKIKSTFK